MTITHDVINDYFSGLIPLSNGNALSQEGFTALADWSEQQDWWKEFAELHHLEAGWRASYMGDPNYFGLTLFRFIQENVVERAAGTPSADDPTQV